MIISRTPFRVSFFGGGTDFPEFFHQHGGAVLSTTIDKYCYITAHRLQRFFKYRIKASYSKTEAVDEPGEIQHPLIRECFLHLGMRDSLEISHVADLPGRTGLGSSSSFTVGLLNVLHHLRGDPVTPEDLARESIHIERTRVGDAGGWQDQYAAAYGGITRIEFQRDGRVAIHKLALTSARLEQLNQHLLLFYLGIEQSAENILVEQRKRVGNNAPTLQEMLSMVGKAESVLTGDSSLDTFGDLLHESWMCKRNLANGVSNTVIDRAYDAARKAGAHGGKLLGAGGRGFLLVFVSPDRHEAVRRTLNDLAEVPFRLSGEGSQIIFQTPEARA